MPMTPDRARDAARLIGKIDAGQWVDMYGRELVDGYLAQIDGTGDAAVRKAESAGAVLTTVAANLLQRSVTLAIETFEREIGGGRQAKGRRALSGGKIKATPQNAAYAVKLYCGVRSAALTFLSAVAGVGGDGGKISPTPALEAAIDALEVNPPDTATAEQKAKLEREYAKLREMTGLPPRASPKDSDDPVN